MTRDEIFALFNRRETAWQARDAAALTADHAPDGVVVSPTGGVLEGRVEIERIYRVWFTAFPDLVFTTEDLLVDDNRVCAALPHHRQPCRRVLRHAADRAAHRSGGRLHLPPPERPHRPRTPHPRLHGLLVQVGVLRAKPAG